MKYKTKISPLIKELELRKNPIIVRVNKFNEDSAKKFANEMAAAHNTGQDIIPVVIDSYGGQVYSLMSMIGAIKNSDLPVATIVEGKAMSCGAILFSFGESGRRYMDPHATLMIHDVSSSEYGKVEEIKASADETERLNQIVYKMMAKNCGHKDMYFLDLVHEKGHADWFLDSKEAKKHGLADHLRLPTLNVNVNVKLTLK
jgi:ATP-dependent Clp protease protease subunit